MVLKEIKVIQIPMVMDKIVHVDGVEELRKYARETGSVVFCLKDAVRTYMGAQVSSEPHGTDYFCIHPSGFFLLAVDKKKQEGSK